EQRITLARKLTLSSAVPRAASLSKMSRSFADLAAFYTPAGSANFRFRCASLELRHHPSERTARAQQRRWCARVLRHRLDDRVQDLVVLGLCRVDVRGLL